MACGCVGPLIAGLKDQSVFVSKLSRKLTHTHLGVGGSRSDVDNERT